MASSIALDFTKSNATVMFSFSFSLRELTDAIAVASVVFNSFLIFVLLLVDDIPVL